MTAEVAQTRAAEIRVVETKVVEKPTVTAGGLVIPTTHGHRAATHTEDIGNPAEPAFTRTEALVAAISACVAEKSASRTFGGARVIIYDKQNFSGARDRFRGDQPNLQQMQVSQMPPHTWNNRISSIRIE
jgi:hypothetical protein